MKTIVFRFALFGKVSHAVKVTNYDGFAMVANRCMVFPDMISSFIDLRHIDL